MDKLDVMVQIEIGTGQSVKYEIDHKNNNHGRHLHEGAKQDAVLTLSKCCNQTMFFHFRAAFQQKLIFASQEEFLLYLVSFLSYFQSCYMNLRRS